jgi:hypothetical protein
MSRPVGRPPVIDTLCVRQGRVRTTQTLVVPLATAREAKVADRLTACRARQLAGLYGAFIRTWTRGLVQPRHEGSTLRLCVAGRGPCLLVLALHEAEVDQGSPPGVRATLAILGGLAVADTAGGGVLVLRLALRHGVPPAGAALEAAVEVDRYAPRLLALPLPAAVCRLLYTMTQASLHRAITSAFLRDLVAALTA